MDVKYEVRLIIERVDDEGSYEQIGDPVLAAAFPDIEGAQLHMDLIASMSGLIKVKGMP